MRFWILILMGFVSNVLQAGNCCSGDEKYEFHSGSSTNGYYQNLKSSHKSNQQVKKPLFHKKI